MLLHPPAVLGSEQGFERVEEGCLAWLPITSDCEKGPAAQRYTGGGGCLIGPVKHRVAIEWQCVGGVTQAAWRRRLCLVMLPELEKPVLQMSHTNGFSPVWVR